MLLRLPPEILIQVFAFLPLKSLVVCNRLNRYIRCLISDSVEIQYLVQRLLSEYVDNPHCKLSTRERLALLRERNRSTGIDARLVQRIKIPFRTSGIYDLTGGLYLVGDHARKTLHYMLLPDKKDIQPDGEVEWNGKQVQMEDVIIDMGLSVYENDLLAIVTFHPKNIEHPNLSDIHLHLYQVSTALPHPDAQRPVILVTQVEHGRPPLSIEIVGSNLVLILAYRYHPQKPDDRIFIYDWKTGVLKMSFRAPYHTYSGLIFLTQDIFLAPNYDQETFDYWRIPEGQSDAPSQPFFKLALPALTSEAHMGIEHIECRAEPSPARDFRYSPQPFHPDPHRAIAVFIIRFCTRETRLIPNITTEPTLIECRFFLFVHRSSLVECLDRFQGSISDNEDPVPVPYDTWGKQVCRWLPTNDYSLQWITRTSGQKCALFSDVNEFVPGPSSPSITMLDFNQTEVARALATCTVLNNGIAEPPGRWVESHSSDREVEFEDGDEEIVTDEGQELNNYRICFLNDVHGCLPFKKCETNATFAYSGVLLNEQGVIGVQGNNRDIVYYG